MEPIRSPAVAGSFYPADPQALRRAVGEHLGQTPGAGHASVAPKLLVVSHAG